MFKLFKADPVKKLEKQYLEKLKAARDAQRGGKIPLFATLTAEAEEMGQRLDELKQNI
jgi:hypothetical protein